MFRMRTGLVLALLFTGVLAQDKPQPIRTDVVFLIDVSGSMREQRGLTRAKQLLTDILDKVVHPGTQVAVIPFGTGVHPPTRFVVPNTPAGAAKKRGQIRRVIESVRARDSYTYLYDSIYSGLETLLEFKEKNPAHGRHIILISDGQRLVRRSDQATARTLAQIIDHFEALGFMRGEDWFIWYGHFGEADDTLRRLLEETGAGRAISLDSLPTLSWAYTRIDPGLVNLGRHRPGEFTETAKFVAITEQSGVGRRVTLDILRGNLPEGMEITVEPRTVKLDDERTEFEVTLHCTGAKPGEWVGAKLIVAAEHGSLHWVESGEVPLHLSVVRPRVDVGTATLKLGRIAPGTATTRAVALIPNSDAAAGAPEIRVTVDGDNLTVDQDRVAVGERRELLVTVTVPRGTEPGEYTGRVRLDGGESVELSPREVAVTYHVGFGHVTVGTDRVDLKTVQVGKSGQATVTFTPAADTEAEIGVEVVGAPDGIGIELPGTVVVHGRVQMPVTVRAPAGTRPGAYEATLRFTAPDGVIVEPAEVPLVFRVLAASQLLLPPLVDLGDVPASRAREIAGRLELAVAEHNAGGELEFVAVEGDVAIEPRVVPLREGKLALPFRLKSMGVEAGSRRCRFDAYLLRDGMRTKAGSIVFRWRVLETFFKVSSWSAPAALPTGDATASGMLVVETSSDLNGRKLRLAVGFEGLTSGMKIAVVRHEVALRGGLQTIPVEFSVSGAHAGHYRGELRLGLAREIDGLGSPSPLALDLEVAGARVEVVAVEGSLDGLEVGKDRILTVVLAATAVPVPTTLELTLSRDGLPGAVDAQIPTVVTFDAAQSTIRVALRFRPQSALPSGEWRPRLNLKSQTEGVAVVPPTVSLRASANGAVMIVQEAKDGTMVWIGLGAALLVLLAALAMSLLRRKPEVVHIAVQQTEPEIPELHELPELPEDDDIFVFEGFDDEDQQD